MEPVLHDKSFIIINRAAYLIGSPKEGDIIVFSDPVSGKMSVKKCQAVKGSEVFVTGINLPESTDSRHYGRIPQTLIIGRVCHSRVLADG